MEDMLIKWCGVAKQFISDLGFPVFVAVWMLVIHDRAMKKLTSAINSLTRAFDRANIRTNNEKEGGDH